MKRAYVSLVCILLVCIFPNVPAVRAQDKPATDKRLVIKNYNGYFPWTPPANLDVWESRKRLVREQVLVATGLWPMPEVPAIKATIHGKIQRDGYTVEKVFFASYPGHYVSGNLYRPTTAVAGKKLPAILTPHGHWANGRFFEEKNPQAQMKPTKAGTTAESTLEGAKYPLQARCAQLARMGCVVFHYDMVGVADSQQIGHRAGFLDVEAELRLQNFMGLQTFNSIRAFDFLGSLPDVDPQRIGVTGASGGGTQTFMLCAVDNRPAAAFPAVMVSTAMQGGCICENCSYLRVDTGNIELAGLYAPKPLGMSGALDWTRDIETKGLPSLKALYKLYGAEDMVMAKARLEFGHNYNQVSREIMYNFFNKHLKLGQPEPVVEKPFVPVPPKELSVYDAEHPLPKDAVDAKGLRRWMTKSSDAHLQKLMPKDEAALKELQKILHPALRAMITKIAPTPSEIEEVGQPVEVRESSGVLTRTSTISRKGAGEAVRVDMVLPEKDPVFAVVWVHPDGRASLRRDGKLVADAEKILAKGGAILAVDCFRTGEKTQAVDKGFAGYTFGYNRPLLANRVHDILSAVAYVQQKSRCKRIHLVGFDRAGPWAILAQALCDETIAHTAADMNQFNFNDVTSFADEMMLPGALKYGGLPVLTALCAPHPLYLHNCKGTGSADWMQAAYKASGKEQNLMRSDEKRDFDAILAWLEPKR